MLYRDRTIFRSSPAVLMVPTNLCLSTFGLSSKISFSSFFARSKNKKTLSLK